MVVPIKWNRRVMSDYVAEFEQQYKKYKTENNTVLGFSFGAMIAFISAPALKPNRLILCSLSPYFSEDLNTLKPWWKTILGTRRMQDFKQFRALQIAKQISAPATFFYGSVEAKLFPAIKPRIESIAKHLPKSKIIIVQNAPHAISHTEYQKAICENIH
ncbi:MAG: alpha/beta hydrolase [Patescibacteria group bacterium]